MKTLMSQCQPLADFAHAFDDLLSNSNGQSTHGAIEHRELGDDVIGFSGLEAADTDHCIFYRIDVAAYNTLQGRNQA